MAEKIYQPGENYQYPLMIKKLLALETAAIGVPDEKWGERPLMIVTLKPDFRGKIGSEELKAFMKKIADEGKLPKHGVPDRYIFMDPIPKTSVGKLDKKVRRTSAK